MPVDRINAPSLNQISLPTSRSDSASIYEEAAVSVEISATTRLRAAGGLPFFADRSGALIFTEDVQSETLANVERSRKGSDVPDSRLDDQGGRSANLDPLQRVQTEQSRKAQQLEQIGPSRALEEQRGKSETTNARQLEEQNNKEIAGSRSYERVTDESIRKKLSEERLKQADRPEEVMQREAALKAAQAARVEEPRPVPETRPVTQTQSAQTQSAQIESAQIQSVQIQSVQIQTAQIQTAQIQTAQIQTAQIQTAQIQDTGTGS
jgi:hypothetical protein